MHATELDRVKGGYRDRKLPGIGYKRHLAPPGMGRVVWTIATPDNWVAFPGAEYIYRTLGDAVNAARGVRPIVSLGHRKALD